MALLVAAPASAANATTELTITKLASDGSTVLAQQTVDIPWMEANLPVYGDGITHYYHQGPVFKDDSDDAIEQALRWNPEEDANVLDKDMGAVKGTNLKDLCDLVGGMNDGEEVLVVAEDGLSKAFEWENVYNYTSREGPMVVTWYCDGLATYPDPYPSETGYWEGMRLVWFADNATNPFGVHAFGNYDWYLAADDDYWYYYYASPTEKYPTTTGLSVKWVAEITILSDDPALPTAAFTADVTGGVAPLTVQFTDLSIGDPAAWAWDFESDGTVDSTQQNPGHVYAAAGTYTVTLTVTNDGGSDDEVRADYITVTAAPVAPVAAFTADVTSGVAPLTVRFTDESTGVPTAWAWDFESDGTVDSTLQDTVFEYATPGTYTVTLTVTNAVGSDDEVKTDYITVTAPPAMDVLYDGAVTLAAGATFDVVAYDSSETYTVNETTPLGALDATGLAYDVTDKRYAYDSVLLLDNVETYLRKSPGYWYAYVNDVYKDGYMNTPAGLNVLELVEGDTVEFYYAAAVLDPADLAEVQGKATAAVLTIAEIASAPPTMDVLYDGAVTLAPGATFEVVPYNNLAMSYIVNETTPLGALDKAASAGGFTYDVTDSRWTFDEVLLLDNVDTYLYNDPGKWYAYVDGVFKDGYKNTPAGLNVIELVGGETVEFYYAADVVDKTDLAEVKAKATAAVLTDVELPLPYDVLFDGTVVLDPEATFDVVAYNSAATYIVNETTPLGALDKAASAGGFTYDVTDSRWTFDEVLLLDNVDVYLYNDPGKWYAYVDGVFKDGYKNNPAGLNVIELVGGETVEFYYAADVVDKTDLAEVQAKATAAVLTVVSTGVTPDDWTLELSGAMDETVSKAFFEEGLACPSSGHYVEWTDDDMNVWGGIPLWVLVSMVDDDPDVGPEHYNFNDAIAATDYEVEVIAGDGWSTTLSSVDIARNDGYIVANTLNGTELPLLTDGGKPFWPLQLKGAAVFGGQQVGNIARIELTGLPAPAEGWTLAMAGEVGDTITQSEFEEGLACPGSGHLVTYIDGDDTWSGVPLWVLLGAIDDYELYDHWTFNDGVAAGNYTINVIAEDGYTRTFYADDVARNDGYIVANMLNGTELDAEGGYPLKLIGPAVTSGKDKVGSIAAIEILELQTPAAAPGSWNLNLSGKITDVIPQAEFEEGLACPGSGHNVSWTDIDGNVWSGMPLWFLCGWVDDRIPHAFDATAAGAGYTITVKAGDGYSKAFASADVAWNDGYIVADKVNGAPLDESWPLRLVGDGVATDGALGGKAVGNIAEIELTEFGEPTEIPQLHIVKYGADGQTVADEVWIDYTEMMVQFDVIGDGETLHSYQAITGDPEDIWGVDNDTKGGVKISNAVKGTRVADLVGLVGGMGVGTDIVFIASDGYETVLPYTSIYPTAEIYEHQGDAIIAWYADGAFVPGYKDGMRLFFMPEDTIYGQWDMHESLPEGYWHYYFQSYSASDPVYGQYAPGIFYPSCAGTSAKYVTEIAVYSTAAAGWDLELDGTRIGGMTTTVDKAYFEAALACQFGANHDAEYTDADENVWAGMPLFFLQGFVDDADQHSDHAYNETLAAAGYDIIVAASDGYAKTFDSRDTIRSTGYLVANTMNGYAIPEDDASWPLRLLGENVSKRDNVKAVAAIVLNYAPNVTAIDAPTAAMTGDDVMLTAFFTDPYDTDAAVIDWGDGMNDTVSDVAGTVTGSHAYAAAGVYTINVTVTDSMGAEDMMSHTIEVAEPSPYDRTMALREYVIALELHQGTETSLLAKLDAALKQMEKNPKTAANILGAFVNNVEAQDGKKIPHDAAMYMIGEANEIIAMLMEDGTAPMGFTVMQQNTVASGTAVQSGSGTNDDTAATNDENAETNNDKGKSDNGNAGRNDDTAGANDSNADTNNDNAGENDDNDNDNDNGNAGNNGNHSGQTKEKSNNGNGKK
ncbi:hypothetical protein AZH53_09650 [Methanomicrobiaceae archaeon CYW5]|nr:hypothetical protein [Methanovulcanius yangii]